MIVLVSIKAKVNARKEIRCHFLRMCWAEALGLEDCSSIYAACLSIFVDTVMAGSIGPTVENVTSKEVVSWWLLRLCGYEVITCILKCCLLLFNINVLLGDISVIVDHL